MAPPIYGIYYPENGGYLHICTLGSGAQGTVSLVRSVVDGAQYVRKMTTPIAPLNPGDAAPEVSLYRPHPLIPKLLHSHAYPVFKPKSAHANMESHSMIFEFCNGGTLTRFLHIRASDETERFLPSKLLVWKLFDDLLTAVHFLHQECTPGIVHGDAHTDNVFLHFPNEQSKIPDFCVGDFGRATAIDANVWEAEGQAGERKLKSLDSVPMADRAEYNTQVQELINDLIRVHTNVGMLMTGLRVDDNVGPDDIIPEQKEDKRWPVGLFDCYDRLDDIIARQTPEAYNEFAGICRDVRKFTRQEAARGRGAYEPDDYRGTQPGVYDWEDAGGRDSRWPPEVPSVGNDRPQLCNSLHKLLASSRDIPGPWKIARVDPDSFAVLSTKRLELGYHAWTLKVWPWAAPDLIPTQVEQFGWDGILEVARSMDNGDPDPGASVRS